MYKVIKPFLLFFFIIILHESIFSQITSLPPSKAQSDDSVQVYIIDSYVTPELPHTFMLSFFTSERAKSKVVIDNKYTFAVSDTLTENHKTQIDISKLKLDKDSVPFVIIITDSLGNESRSDFNSFDLPKEMKIKSESNFLLLCIFGGTVFLLPTPSFVLTKDKNYFSLTKEIPLISIKKEGFSYPSGYISLEYSHIFNAPVKNILRLGYKHIIEIPALQYISPGLDAFTNFEGFNGISPEFSVGMFKVLDSFIVYLRYRYNFKPGDSKNDFHEISLGLYSNFFSIHI
jgi:hypothetical protein